MNRILTFIRFGVPVLLLFSCGFSFPVPKEKAIVFKKFPEEKVATAVDCFTISALKPSGLDLYNDSFLIVRNANNTSNYHFSIFNLHTKQFQLNVLGSGRKKGNSMGFLSYGILGDHLWVNDIIKEKLILTSLDSALYYKNDSSFTEIAVPTFFYSVRLLAPTELLGSGDYESENRLALLNLSTGVTERKMVPYSQDSTLHYTRPEKMAYESFLFLKPSQDKCVLAARYADRIQLFDLNSGTSSIIKGPENYEPDVSPMVGSDGKELSARNAKTRFAFVRGKTTNRFVYLLYSGNNHQSENHEYGKYIYIYDWSGTPVKKIDLPVYIVDFAVTSNDTTIYVCDPKSKSIKSINLGTL